MLASFFFSRGCKLPDHAIKILVKRLILMSILFGEGAYFYWPEKLFSLGLFHKERWVGAKSVSCNKLECAVNCGVCLAVEIVENNPKGQRVFRCRILAYAANVDLVCAANIQRRRVDVFPRIVDYAEGVWMLGEYGPAIFC